MQLLSSAILLSKRKLQRDIKCLKGNYSSFKSSLSSPQTRHVCRSSGVSTLDLHSGSRQSCRSTSWEDPHRWQVTVSPASDRVAVCTRISDFESHRHSKHRYLRVWRLNPKISLYCLFVNTSNTMLNSSNIAVSLSIHQFKRALQSCGRGRQDCISLTMRRSPRVNPL